MSEVDLKTMNLEQLQRFTKIVKSKVKQRELEKKGIVTLKTIILRHLDEIEVGDTFTVNLILLLLKDAVKNKKIKGIVSRARVDSAMVRLAVNGFIKKSPTKPNLYIKVI